MEKAVANYFYQSSKWLVILTFVYFVFTLENFWNSFNDKQCGTYNYAKMLQLSTIALLIHFTLCFIMSIFDRTFENLGILEQVRMQPKYKKCSLKQIDWDFVTHALQLSICNSIVSFVIFNTIFLKFLIWRGSCISIFDYTNGQLFVLFLFKVPFTYLTGDFIFYSIHRLYHTFPYLYRVVHHKHHEWRHTFGIQAIACTFWEHISCNLVTVYGTPFIWGLPIEFVFLFVILSSITTIGSHCGYRFENETINEFFSSKTHALHHFYRDCEFGLSFTDKLFGTTYENIHKKVTFIKE